MEFFAIIIMQIFDTVLQNIIARRYLSLHVLCKMAIGKSSRAEIRTEALQVSSTNLTRFWFTCVRIRTCSIAFLVSLYTAGQDIIQSFETAINKPERRV